MRRLQECDINLLACALVAGIEANVDRMRRPAVVVADFSRNVRHQGEKKREGERRNSYESDIHSQYDNYQTSFEHSSNEEEGLRKEGKPETVRSNPKYVLADFSQRRRAKSSLRSERSALNQDGSSRGVIDRNRMDQIEDTVYIDQPPKRIEDTFYVDQPPKRRARKGPQQGQTQP